MITKAAAVSPRWLYRSKKRGHSDAQRPLLIAQPPKYFNDAFDPSVSQEQVFNDVCLDIVHSALDGYNGTILAYGQTGSGKTHTITGGEHYADRGIIPRVLSIWGSDGLIDQKAGQLITLSTFDWCKTEPKS